MKKNILCIVLAFSSYASAQVGIGTDQPNATLDITINENEPITTPFGLLIPRISRASAQNVTITPEESTLIYVNDISNGTQTDAAADIDAKGFYYYSRVKSKWMKIYNNPDDSVDFTNYTFNSGLTSDTVGNTTNVTLGGVLNKGETTFIETTDTSNLEITGNSVNAFSVDDETFSVDAKNNRIGIGTTTPKSTLQVLGDVQFSGVLKVGNGDAGTEGQYLVSNGPERPPIWSSNGPNGTLPNPIALNAENGISRTEVEGNYTIKLGGTVKEHTELIIDSQKGGKLLIKDGGVNAFSVGEDNLSVDNTNDRVGIGTTSPTTKLDVNGQIRIRGGIPGAGKVLTASSTTGLASWQTPANEKTKATNGLSHTTSGDLTTVKLGGDLSERTDIYTKGNKFVIYTTIEDGFGINQEDFSVDGATHRIGIGTTSPEAKLHVAGDAYIKDKVGIGVSSPTEQIDINGSARLRGLKQSSDENDYEIVTDNTGVLKRKTAPTKIVVAVLDPTGYNGYAVNNRNGITNTYLDLPKGRWLIQASVLIKCKTLKLNTSQFIRTTFSDTTNGNPSDDLVSGKLISGSINGPAEHAVMNGSLIINNTDDQVKRYYYVLGKNDFYLSTGIINTTSSDRCEFINFASDKWSENNIFAMPL